MDRLFAEIDVLQSLLERVGGAKQSLASANYRRSSPQDSSFDTIHFKLSECSAAIQRLESTVSLFIVVNELMILLIVTPNSLLKVTISSL